jgi:hypothetical protein
MPLTKDFKETVGSRLDRSSTFRRELLQQAVGCLLSGDVDTGKALLRDYVNGTIGFERLSDQTKTPAKSLMRMLGPSGNPQARNLFSLLEQLQRIEGVRLTVSARRPSSPAAALRVRRTTDERRYATDPEADEASVRVLRRRRGLLKALADR